MARLDIVDRECAVGHVGRGTCFCMEKGKLVACHPKRGQTVIDGAGVHRVGEDLEGHARRRNAQLDLLHGGAPGQDKDQHRCRQSGHMSVYFHSSQSLQGDAKTTNIRKKGGLAKSAFFSEAIP